MIDKYLLTLYINKRKQVYTDILNKLNKFI